MSKELENIENIAKMKCITDHDHIDRIIRYMISMPFSFFKKDEKRYEYLKNDLCKGFKLRPDDVSRISLKDVLVLIGYEPGNPYFNPPDTKELHRRMGKRFNVARDCYAIALLINNLSMNNIRIKEFTRIEVSAYTDYLRKKVEDGYKNNLIPSSTYSDIIQKIEVFKNKAYNYGNVSEGVQTVGCELTNGLTMGNIISKALTICGSSWICPSLSFETYRTAIIESYDLINRLFMDSIRMPLISQNRERFQEIINQCRDRSLVMPVQIDYETCYEH